MQLVPEDYYFTQLSFSNDLNLSSFDDYPANYKFISLEFYAASSNFVTSRKCYDLLDLAADVGGIMSIIMIVGQTFCEIFGETATYGKIAN